MPAYCANTYRLIRRQRCIERAKTNAKISKWLSIGPFNCSNGGVENMLEEKNGELSKSTITGALECAWCHPTDANTIIIGAVGGGIWKTTNASDGNDIVWEPKTDKLSTSITALCSDINNPERLVAVSGSTSSYGNVNANDADQGIVISTDQGDTWIRKNIVINEELFRLDLNAVVCWDNNILVGSHRFGITNLESAGQEDYDTAGGVFMSQDFGNTWIHISQIPDKPVTCLEITQDENGAITLYACVLTQGIYKSIDQGVTWTNITENTPDIENLMNSANNNLLISACKGVPNVLYTIIVQSGQAQAFLYSIDSGSNWILMNSPMTKDSKGNSHYLHPTTNKDGTPKTGGKPGSQGAYHLSLYAHPVNENIVFVGGDRQPEIGGLMQNTYWTARLFRGDRTKSNNLTSMGYSFQWSHITHTNTITDPDYGGLIYGGTSNNSAPHADSRFITMDILGNLIEVDDGGIYKLIDPMGKEGKWYSLVGNLNTFEVHSIAYDSNNKHTLCGTQDNGNLLFIESENKTIDMIGGGDGGDVQASIFGKDVSVYSYSTQRGGNFTIDVYKKGMLVFKKVFDKLYPGLAFTPKTSLNRYNYNLCFEDSGPGNTLSDGIYIQPVNISEETCEWVIYQNARVSANYLENSTDIGYDNSVELFMDTIPTVIPENGVLIVDLKWEIENVSQNGTGHDAANIRISIDGGNTWSLLESEELPYNFTEASGWEENNVQYRDNNSLSHLTSGWGGNSSGFQSDTVFDLSSYSGQTAIIRFAFGSDASMSTDDDATLTGFHVRNIRISGDEDIVYSADNTEVTFPPILKITTDPDYKVIDDSEYGTYNTVEKIIYGHKDDPDAIFFVTNNNVYIRKNGILHNIDILQFVGRYNPPYARIRNIAVNPDNINQLCVVTGYNTFSISLSIDNLSNTDKYSNNENRVIIIDYEIASSGNVGNNVSDHIIVNSIISKKVGKNATYSCLFIRNNIYIGHSQGVVFYNPKKDVFLDFYPNTLPNVQVLDMVYDENDKVLVIGTMGRGTYRITVQ